MSGEIILVVADAADALPACLRTAVCAAAAFSAPRIEVLHVRLDPMAAIEPSEEVLTARYKQEIELRTAAEGAALRVAYDAWRAAARPAACTWSEVVGVPAEVMRERGRTAALLVLAARSDALHPSSAEGFDAAMFETGKPVLVVPHGADAPFGHHLAVGWRDMPATRRSLATLSPWLLAARTVSLIHVGADAAPPPADWAAANLPAGTRLHTVAPDRHGDAAALLDAAVRLGADGLVIGSSRHGRLIERLLGGVTDHVLRAAPMPVLLHA